MGTAHYKNYTPASSRLTLNMLHLPQWSAMFSTLSKDICSFIQPTSLRLQPGELIYTDGCHREVPYMGLATIYRMIQNCVLSLRVKPYREGWNTMSRAVLIAILVALKHCDQTQTKAQQHTQGKSLNSLASVRQRRTVAEHRYMTSSAESS